MDAYCANCGKLSPIVSNPRNCIHCCSEKCYKELYRNYDFEVAVKFDVQEGDVFHLKNNKEQKIKIESISCFPVIHYENCGPGYHITSLIQVESLFKLFEKEKNEKRRKS